MTSTPTIRGESKLKRHTRTAINESILSLVRIAVNTKCWNGATSNGRQDPDGSVPKHCESSWTDQMRMRAVRLGVWRRHQKRKELLDSIWWSVFAIHHIASSRYGIQSAKGHPEILEHGSAPILLKAGKKNLNGLTPMILLNDVSNIRMRVQMAFWSSAGVDASRRLEALVCGHGKADELWFLDHRISMALLLLMICGKNWLTTYWSRGLFQMERISRLPRHWWTAVMKRKRCINSSTDGSKPNQRFKGIGGTGRPIGRPSKSSSAKSQSFLWGQTKQRMLFLAVSRFRKLVSLLHIPETMDAEWCFQLTSGRL